MRNIELALRQEAQVLYLICHGRGGSDDRDGVVWLEQDDGMSDIVPSSVLVEMIRQARAKPPMVVLAFCHSAGDIHRGGVFTLSAELMRIGVPAVIGFTGPVTAEAARTVLAPLFIELQTVDGVLDRAMALARPSLRHHSWWQPVLWMRADDGHVWAPEQTLRGSSIASSPEQTSSDKL